jgi:decaprenyl-phosphate phosphoribosyltransferase
VLKYFKLLRPKHWIKNLFLFAAPFFGGSLFHEETVLMAFPAFIAFSLCASAAYIFNDIKDIEKDKLHSEKMKRPIASGSISRRNASIFAFSLMAPSFILSYKIAPAFFSYILLYLSIQVVYSLYLKNIALLDIFCIASGFVIRVLAGGTAFNVEVSHWLLLTMFMISIVLATGKRLGEINLLNEKAEEHRKSLIHYSTATLNEILLISASASLITYSLYTIEQFQSLVYTVPIVTLGLFRYIMLSKQGMGDPTDALTGDKWLVLTVGLWLIVVGILRYN